MNIASQQKKIVSYLGMAASLLVLLRLLSISMMLGVEGSGFYLGAFGLCFVIILVVSTYISQTITKMTSVRMAKGQARTCHKIFLCSLVFSVIIGILLSILVFFGAEFLSNILFEQFKCQFSLQALAPVIVFSCISGSIKGYLRSYGVILPIMIIQFVEQLIIFGLGFLLIPPFAGYGEKVGNLLRDSSYKAVYGTMGASFSIVICAILSFVAYILLYKNTKKTINKAIARDNNMKDDSYKKIIRIIMLTTLPSMLIWLCIQGQFFINFVMYSKSYDLLKIDNVSNSYFLGIYFGVAVLLLMIPLVFYMEQSSSIASTVRKMILEVNMKNKGMVSNIKIVKDYIRTKIRITIITSIPIAFTIAILSKQIASLITKEEVIITASLIASGAILIVIYSVWFVLFQALQGCSGKQMICLFIAFVSGFVHFITSYIFVRKFKLGLDGMIISAIIFGLLLLIVTYAILSKTLKYRQEWGAFITPIIGVIIMGIVQFIVVSLLGETLGNIVTLITCLLLGYVVYWGSILLLRGVTSRELQSIPSGTFLIKISAFLQIK